MTTNIPVFDGHNDLLLRLERAPERRDEIFLKRGLDGHLDLPRMREGGFAGGLFAIYVPSPPDPDAPDLFALMEQPPYDVPLPAPVPASEALPIAISAAAQMLWMERASEGGFVICRTAAEIRSAMERGAVAGVMHMEGAEAIGEDLDALHVFHGLGLRSLGPVWSRPTIFGHGVPFRYPGNPDIGAGLTVAGKALVRECNALGILVDLSHLNEKGFDDVARISSAPLVATHSNAHALCPSPRNLTDRQLAQIAESGGMVGLNFATFFLREDGLGAADCELEPMIRHIDYLIGKLGEDHVGFGSDFDGCVVPAAIGDVTGLPRLLEALRVHGFDDDLLQKLAYRNWIATLENIIGA
ncbi:dipeptidase [Aliiruegeria sabulilitoris]|uniref:dipeptidase n=1 Tax=Aliiruegeria sabulilitoris TaxID=1510458 RepID=UPI000832B1A9|nr:dipeptidase [Aliiruegeria sabulilitoris]NDR59631.1 membrane dipeptidase [Pseudoruegeria sp. M32A2M]